MVVLGCLLIACEEDRQDITQDAFVADDAAVEPPPIDAPTAVILTLRYQPIEPEAFDFVVAYQEDTGAWTRAPSPVGDEFILPIRSERYGVLVACTGGYGGSSVRQRIVQVEHFTLTETHHLTLSLDGCGDPRVTGTIHGTISNLGTSPSISVAAGEYARTDSAGSSYQVSAPQGVRDLVAHRITPGNRSDAILIDHDMSIGADTPHDIDFASSTPTVQRTVTGLASPVDRVNTWNYFHSKNGTIVRLSSSNDTGFWTSPPEVRQPGDLDRLYVLQSNASLTQLQWFERWGGPDGDVAVSMRAIPKNLTCATSTTTPVPRVSVSWSPLLADRTVVAVRHTTQGLGESLYITMALSKGYLGSASTWEVPDFTTIQGWPATYNSIQGFSTVCAVEVSDATTGPAEFSSTKHMNGVVIRGAGANLIFTP